MGMIPARAFDRDHFGVENGFARVGAYYSFFHYGFAIWRGAMRRGGACLVFLFMLSPVALAGHSAIAAEWSGFHVGASLGASASDAEAQTSVRTQGGYFTGDDPALINEAGRGSMRQAKPAVGLQAGYDRQFGNLLVGVVASANSLFFDDVRSTSAGYNTVPSATFALTQKVEAQWQATLRPRIGWAEDDWLVYASAGVAVTQMKIDSTFTDTGFSAFSRSSETDFVPGWSVGVGGEYALNRNWSLSGEYLYTSYDSSKNASAVSETSGVAVPATLEHSAELKSHALMIGLVYRFNP